VLAERVEKVVAQWAAAEGWETVPACELARPAEEAHGDYATRCACRWPGSQAIAESVGGRVARAPAGRSRDIRASRPDRSGRPGFLNFTLSGKPIPRRCRGCWTKETMWVPAPRILCRG